MPKPEASQLQAAIIETPMVDRAFALLRQQPWPEDIADQLARLEKQARGQDRELFGAVWESYIVQGGE